MRIKIRATLTTAHGYSGKGILEDLFKSKELENTEIYGGMKSQSTFVGAYGTIELHSKTLIHMNLTIIVFPCYSEHNDTLWFYDSLKDLVLHVFWILLNHRYKSVQHLSYCLMEFWLCWIFLLHFFNHIFYIFLCVHISHLILVYWQREIAARNIKISCIENSYIFLVEFVTKYKKQPREDSNLRPGISPGTGCRRLRNPLVVPTRVPDA